MFRYFIRGLHRERALRDLARQARDLPLRIILPARAPALLHAPAPARVLPQAAPAAL